MINYKFETFKVELSGISEGFENIFVVQNTTAGGRIMKIHLTKKEYKALLDMLYITHAVLHGFHMDTREETLKYWELEQKLYSFTKGFDAEDLVSYDNKYQEYMPTRKFDDETPAKKHLEEYDKEVFWDELIESLAKRDLIEKHGPEIMQQILKDEAVFNELRNYKIKYSEEFEKNGIKNLLLS